MSEFLRHQTIICSLSSFKVITNETTKYDLHFLLRQNFLWIRVDGRKYAITSYGKIHCPNPGDFCASNNTSSHVITMDSKRFLSFSNWCYYIIRLTHRTQKKIDGSHCKFCNTVLRKLIHIFLWQYLDTQDFLFQKI